MAVWVSTASKAMDPTTVRLMRASRVSSGAVRAIRISEWGGPEVLELVEDAPVPEPGDGQVLIRVARAGVNFADTHARENSYLAKLRAAADAGRRGGGRARGRPGQRVVALVGTGGYAEYVAADEATVFPIEDGVSDATALALLLQGLTAWHLYRTSAKLAEGEIGRRARGGRRRRLARRPARPPHGRGARDRHRLDGGEARAGAVARRRRGGRRRTPTTSRTR